MSPVAGPPRDATRRGLLSYGEQLRLAKAIEGGRQAEQRLTARRLPAAERRHLEEEVARAAAARRELIEAHAPLVLTEAQRYAGPERRTVVELVQQGNTGLVRAVDSFDWRRGVRFSTYATRWIRLAIAAERPGLPDPLAFRPDPGVMSRYRDRVVSLDAGRPPASDSSSPERALGAADILGELASHRLSPPGAIGSARPADLGGDRLSPPG